MQGLILAAGMGKRLKEYTKNNTKCMVEVNEKTLIERVLRQLDKYNLSQIVIVIGYKGVILKNYINALNIKTPIVYVRNDIYNKTNNIYSLALAKDYLLNDDTLLLESDLIFEDSIFDLIINDPRESLVLVDKYAAWMDGTCIEIDENDNIVDFISGNHFKYSDSNNYYKTVNVYKFSKHFLETYYVPFLEAYQKALGENEYYEQVLRVITMLDKPEIKAKRLNGEKWYEIDDAQDLKIASILFADDTSKIKMIQDRYGGYWRFTDMLDFCYLVNPYYPPKKLIDEMQYSFTNLLTQYPSGLSVNNALAAKNFDVKEQHILVGNGAAEIINNLMPHLTGKVGFIKPSFDEYFNKYTDDKSVVFVPDNDDFSYTVDDLIKFYTKNMVKSIILVNPDNPSGNYIKKSEVLRFADWCKIMNIRLIIDESFIDFTDERETFISESIISKYKTMIIIKSISKSHGVPGLRLGVMVSHDTVMINKVRSNTAIWNINSFGEFYMQIADKYKKDYIKALDEYKITRRNFIDKLSEIKCLKVIPTQANFVMVELLNTISSKELIRKLLADHNILIKDLYNKMGHCDKYIRLAIRNEADNNKLVTALKKVLEDGNEI